MELLGGEAVWDLVRVAKEGETVRSDGDLTPSCPTCGSPMIRRTARRGEHAGEEFWGCSRYPECRGISLVGDNTE